MEIHAYRTHKIFVPHRQTVKNKSDCIKDIRLTDHQNPKIKIQDEIFSSYEYRKVKIKR